jgi:putative hydrolases of HD superfamily
MAQKKIDRIDTLLEFLKEIEKLKLIERKVFVSNKKRYENDAEHSWHMAMFVMLFEKELLKDIDITKMLKMSLIHDLVEIYAGDTFFFDQEHHKTKKDRETKAAKKLFGILPDDLKKEFNDIFNEFEEKKTKESIFVKSFDQLQPMLQNIVSGGYGWKLHKVTDEDVRKHKMNYMVHDEEILNIYKKLFAQAKQKKLL